MSEANDTGAGGCARKLEEADLKGLIEAAQSAEPVDRSRATVVRGHDSVRISMPTSETELLSSGDLLYAFGGDSATFGRVATTHALSDIYAALGSPRFATLLLGVTRRGIKSGEAHSMLRSVVRTLSEGGAAFGGAHTVVVPEGFIGLAVVGAAPRDVPSGRTSPGDAVVLSKSLGSGFAITAERLGLWAGPQLDAPLASMAQSNQEAAQRLAETLARDPSAVRAVTDVSGFGFLNALHSIIGDAHAQVEEAAIPLLPCVEVLIEQQCWSALLDANLVSSEAFTNFNTRTDSMRMPAALTGPETSGGLLAIVSADALHEVIGDGRMFTHIGHVVEPRHGPQIEVV